MLEIFNTFNATLGLTSLIVGVLTFIIYLIAVRSDFGNVKSISMSYYYVKPHWLFQVFIWVSAASIMLSAQTLMHMIAGTCLLIMAAYPTIKEKKFYIPHMIFAITGITVAVIGIGVEFGLWWLIGIGTLLAGIATLLTFKKDTYIYWIEVISIATVIIGIFLGRFIK